MLLIVVRLLEVGLKVYVQRKRTLPVPSERVCAEGHVRLDAEIVDFVPEEGVLSLCVPCKVFLVLSLSSCIQVHGVLKHIGAALDVVGRLETVVVQELVSDSDVKLGDDAVALPRLQADEEPVLQPHDSE